MYTAIKNYCNNGNNNGLFLLDMPTGYGKTYFVLKYIYEASLDESNSKRRFFFITTLKKNLPVEELKNWFTEAGQLDAFNEKFLFIDANADCVIDGLTSEIINEIPSEIKKTDEYKSFVQDIELFKDNYHKERYVRIALAYKQFVMHNDIQSFLCVLTKHPRKGDKYLNKDVLDEIFKYIIVENNASISVNSSSMIGKHSEVLTN